jgi:2-polyprenyl-3-methyl-5-hydroxy-6-metoxy-1,4-benzoquinol methylase
MKTFNLPLKECFKKDFGFFRTRQTFSQIQNYIEGKDIIDIGCGTGHLSKILKDEGYDIVAIDIKNRIQVRDIEPIVYDGLHVPSLDNAYDVALLMTVLHHTSNPFAIIEEALRVAKRVIIIEDIYDTVFEKYKTFLLDSIFNFEFFTHPHSNKKDNEWRKYFNDNNMKLIYSDYWITKTPIGDIKQALYCIEKNN